jgi:hypothetical protein
MSESLTILEYEQMMKAHDPELFLVKQKLKELRQRKFGELRVSFKVSDGRVALEREITIRLTNIPDSLTGRTKLDGQI